MWEVIAYFKIVCFLTGMQGGYTKYFRDNRNDAAQYATFTKSENIILSI